MHVISLQTSESPSLAIELPLKIKLLGGLHPFLCERFTLSAETECPPFLRMDAEGEDLAFHLVDPFLVLPGYEPELSTEDDRELDLRGPGEAMLLSLVNLSRGAPAATLNLAAPIVVNMRTKAGKQAVLHNASAYSVRHPLLAP